MITEKFIRKESLKTRATHIGEKSTKVNSPRINPDLQRKAEPKLTQSPRTLVKHLTLKPTSKLEDLGTKSPRLQNEDNKQKLVFKSNSPISRKIFKESPVSSLKWEAKKRAIMYQELSKHLDLNYLFNTQEKMSKKTDFIRPSTSEKYLKTFLLDRHKSPRGNDKFDSERAYRFNNSPRVVHKAINKGNTKQVVNSKKYNELRELVKNFKSEHSSPMSSLNGSFSYKIKTDRIAKLSPSKIKMHIKIPHEENLADEENFEEEEPICPFRIAKDAE